MTNLDIAYQRLHNQLITQRTFEKPGDVVQWLGAVQAQDYAAAKWAVGLRLQGVTSDDIEQAFAAGAILRRVYAASAYWYRRLELDDATCRCSNAVLANALQGGKQLTRPELVSVLQQAGIATDDLQRFTYLMMRAELDGIVCSGARRGKQFTYALLDERAPQARTLDRDEALAELSRRYFTSHGPATLKDYIWWSGLTAADASSGLEMVKSKLIHEAVDGQTYWFSTATPPAKDLSSTVYLLPNFDEYIVGYTDRSAVFDASHTKKLDPRGNILFNYTIVMDGRVVGTWKRTLKKDAVIITPSLFTPLNTAETRAFAVSANRYGAFLESSVNTTF